MVCSNFLEPLLNIKVYLTLRYKKYHTFNQIMNTNIKQIFQKVLQNLSIVGVSLSVFNTYNNLTTIKNLRDNLEIEKDINQQLALKVNNLVSENESNTKLEIIVRKKFRITRK
jgi:hypothetical protein